MSCGDWTCCQREQWGRPKSSVCLKEQSVQVLHAGLRTRGPVHRFGVGGESQQEGEVKRPETRDGTTSTVRPRAGQGMWDEEWKKRTR